ncbi:MAG: PRC-barrel domain-containing protein [Pararhodobacter sp.]|nr:PRC-barrel domain-containing protein [Pararhodobacter sp.]
MRLLITTTALALIMAGPVVAQTTTGQQGTQAGEMSGQSGIDGTPFTALQPGDLLASELMDATIHAPAQAQELDQQPGQQTSRWAASADSVQLQDMENIGNVNDLLLDEQGSIQAILVDVGGFLGIGARQVAIGLDQVNFVTDPNNPEQIHLVTSMRADALENAPEFDHTAQQARGMQQPATAQQDEWRGDRQGLAAPDVQREGFQQAQADEISADDMLDANLFDVNDDNVGNVTDVVLGAEGEAQYIVADVGGFLGLGAHSVAIGFDEVSIMRDQDRTELRIYVDVTEDTLRSMPEYEAG